MFILIDTRESTVIIIKAKPYSSSQRRFYQDISSTTVCCSALIPLPLRFKLFFHDGIRQKGIYVFLIPLEQKR